MRPHSPAPLRSALLPMLLAAGLAACAGTAPREDAPAAARVEAAAAAPDAVAAAPEGDAAALPEASAPEAASAVDTGAAAATEAPASPPAAEGMAGDARTQAERDFDAIYGDPYNPVADPTLPAPAQLPQSYDPWERWNRRVHAFNNVVDRTVAKPLAQAYVAVVPRPVRLGVSNFFNNLGQPVSALNALLQGKPKQAGQSFARFMINSTVGLAGFLDPATAAKLPNTSEDFGQTLGVWGWRTSRYVELPLFGPRTVRDTFGLFGDAPLSPIRQIEEDEVRYFVQGLQLVDVRTQLLPLDSLREGAADEYALFRDGWMQRRNYQIFGDARRQNGEDLPDYLLDEETNPTVPADAMPIIPGAPTP